MTIVELFSTIKGTAGTNDKKQLLADNMTDLVKAIFEAAYGEHKYFVTKVELNDYGTRTIEDGWFDFEQVLHQCECRHITGNEARFALQHILEEFAEKDQEILYNIIKHNLKIGISEDNFYAVIGKPVNKHEVSLAENLKDVKNVDPIDGTFYASRKLDGVRCVAFVEKNEEGFVSKPIFISRQNKVFTTLDKLTEQVRFLAGQIPTPGRYVFDGEVCILDENGDEHFDWVMKEITRKNHTIENPCYNIFDFVPEEVFYKREQGNVFSVRLQHLKEMYENALHYARHLNDVYSYLREFGNRIHILNQERITCQDDFDRWAQYVKEGNWEGFMLRKDIYYKGGRSKDLLKVKPMQDAEYVVTGTINGVVTYNEGGQKDFNACSALTIEHKGNVVKVGSGLSKEQRLRWYDHPEEIVGKTITVQYFEETMDKKTKQYSLRFPILKCVYENGRDV